VKFNMENRGRNNVCHQTSQRWAETKKLKKRGGGEEGRTKKSWWTHWVLKGFKHGGIRMWMVKFPSRKGREKGGWRAGWTS